MKRLKFKKFLIIPSGIFVVGCIFISIYYKSISEKQDIILSSALDKPNVILIVIDSLRPDHLSCYGYERDTSPNIDNLAKEATMFTQAIAAGGCTIESVASILTGTYSFIHYVKWWNMHRDFTIKTLTQYLSSIGFVSALFTDHSAISATDIKDNFNLIYITERENALRLTLELTNWVKKNKDKPFFIYLHYHGVHAPYRPPEPYKSKYLYDRFRIRKEIPISNDKTNKYRGKGNIPYIVAENNISDVSYYIAKFDGKISYIDYQVGRLIESLKRLGLLEDTLLILTADHGEMLGEHNIYFTHGNCYESNIRVPLIIRFPKLFPRREIISQQVSLIDIIPTILEIMEIDIPDYIQGKSLLTLFKKNKSDQHVYLYSSNFDPASNTASIRSESWKLIRKSNTIYELYNLIDDLQEQHNLINKEQDKFEELKRILEIYEKGSSPFKEKKNKLLTDKEKEILRSLGYLQ